MNILVVTLFQKRRISRFEIWDKILKIPKILAHSDSDKIETLNI